MSLVKSLNNQLSEKDEIKFLNSKIKQLSELVDKLRSEKDDLKKTIIRILRRGVM